MLTAEEYLEMERESEIRHEFYDGEIFTLENTTKNHNKIIDNVKAALKQTFVPKGCDVFSETISLEAIKGRYYPYPDILLTCDKRDKEDEYLVRFPALIVEVLSKSTSDSDHGFKWQRYRKIPSLQYYMMISQYEFLVELYSRLENKPFWRFQTYEAPEDTVILEKLGFALSLKTIYESIIFPVPADGE